MKKISDDDRDIEEPNAEETNDFDSTLHTDPPRDIEQDIKNEEEEIRALEEKKRALEERVSGMEKDLGGLLR